MKYMKNIDFWKVFGCFLILLSVSFFAEARPEQTPKLIGPTGTYISGGMPFAQKTKVTIARNGETYAFIPPSGDSFVVPLKQMRGAVSSVEGIWIYWFDVNGATQTAYFELSNSQALVDAITTAIKSANIAGQPMSADELELQRQRYEEYKAKALKEAK